MKLIRLVLLLILLPIAAACGGIGPTPPPGPNQTWIDAPLPNSTLPEAPYLLQFHAASHLGVEQFEVRVNGVLLASVSPGPLVGEGGPQGTLFYGLQEWVPPGPGEYLIAVLPKSSNGSVGPQVEVHVTVGELAAEGGDEPPPQEGASCTYLALVALFCREGPGTVYLERDTFNEGDTADVVGQSPDGLHAVVVGPHNNVQCYVPVGEPWGELQGSCEDLSVLIPPPTPTGTPPPPPPPTPTLTTPSPTPSITPIPPPA